MGEGNNDADLQRGAKKPKSCEQETSEDVCCCKRKGTRYGNERVSSSGNLAVFLVGGVVGGTNELGAKPQRSAHKQTIESQPIVRADDPEQHAAGLSPTFSGKRTTTSIQLYPVLRSE